MEISQWIREISLTVVSGGTTYRGILSQQSATAGANWILALASIGSYTNATHPGSLCDRLQVLL